MSIVNLKIIFEKKQKQTRKSPTQGLGATFIITEMAVFPLEKDYSCETGYSFDDSRVCFCFFTKIIFKLTFLYVK